MKKESIKVIIADDQEIFREGLELVISKQSGIQLLAQAVNGRELVEMVKQLRPDVVLTDIVMPVMDGIIATRQIMQQFPSTGILALSMFDEEAMINDMFEAGALGYLIKNADKQEIYDAVSAAYMGKPYYCRATSLQLSRILSRKQKALTDQNARFTEKELGIIRGICNEMSNAEMAKQMYMSKRTIDGYRSRILDKMGVKTAIGVVKYALKNDLYKY